MQFKGARGIRLIHLLKIGVDTRKYSRIVSNLLNMLEDAESFRFNMHWFCKGISLKLKDSPFLSASLKQQEIQWWHSKLLAQNIYIGIILGPVHQCIYDNIDSFMNIFIDLHNFRIYDAKEYISTSFPEIFGQTYNHRYLSRSTS